MIDYRDRAEIEPRLIAEIIIDLGHDLGLQVMPDNVNLGHSSRLLISAIISAQVMPDNVNALLEGDHTRRIHKARAIT